MNTENRIDHSFVSNWPKTAKFVLAAILIGHLLLHAALWLVTDTSLYKDALKYWEFGTQVARGDVWQTEPLQLFRPPLYPWFLGVLQSVSGDQAVNVATAIQHLLGFLTTVIVLRICLQVSSCYKTAIAGVLFSSMCVTRAWFDSQLLAESLFTFLLTLSCLHAVKWLLTPNTKSGIWTGVFLSLTTLTRPTGQYLIVVLACGFVLAALVRHCKFKVAITGFAACLISYSLLLTPWLVRNYQHTGELKLAHASGRALWLSAVSHLDKGIGHHGAGLEIPWNNMSPQLKNVFKSIESDGSDLYHTWSVFNGLIQRGFSEVVADKTMKRLAMVAVANHPAAFLTSVRSKISEYWMITQVKDRGQSRYDEKPKSLTQWGKHLYRFYAINLQPFVNAFLALAAVLSCFLVMYRKPKPMKLVSLFILVLLCYFTMITAVGGQASYRYRMVIEPLVCVALSLGTHIVVINKFRRTPSEQEQNQIESDPVIKGAT